MSDHPAAAIFPKLTGSDFDSLVEDIREHGLQNPITLLKGKVIDGRNRLAACEVAGIEPEYEDLDPSEDPYAFVLSMNLHRRHLEPHQKGLALRAVMERRNGKSSGGRTPRAAFARDVGMSKQTLHDNLAAADAYDALPKPVKAQVDSGNLSVPNATAAVEKMRRSPRGRAALEVLEGTGSPKKLPDEVREVFDEHAEKARKAKAFDKWWNSVVTGFEYWVPYVQGEMLARDRRCLSDGIKKIRKHLSDIKP